MKISIIIPTLNEAGCIERTLESLAGQAPPFEIIVADGGSSDETRDIVSDVARVVDSQRGRAHQMNAGAAGARGDIFLFLHADTLLPPNALDTIRQAVAGSRESGIFRLQFDRHSPLLNFYSFCTRLKIARFCFGDRALFVKKNVFEELGGFPPISIFEDIEMSKMLHRRGTFVFLEEAVVTSARRFETYGTFRQQLLNSYLWSRYLLGASPGELAPYYAYDEPSTTDEAVKP